MTSGRLQTNQPLADRTIVITRSRTQSESFASELERLGARVVSCPTIEIIPPENYDALDGAIENLYGYDWIIFTSTNGVDFFVRRFAELGHELHELEVVRVCAIGDSTAARLRDVNIHVDIVPEQFQAEGIFNSLKDYLGGTDGFKSLNFLMPRATAARDYLPLALEEVGARVDVVPTYRTVKPNNSELGRVAALLEGGAIDCIAFTSSSSVTNFAQLFDSTDLAPLLNGVAVACIGDITAATASHFGLGAAIIPRDHTIAELASAIVAHFEDNTR